MELTLESIAKHLQGQLAHLDEMSDIPGQVSFDEYKAIYDTYIQLRQAQALRSINDHVEYIARVLDTRTSI